MEDLNKTKQIKPTTSGELFKIPPYIPRNRSGSSSSKRSLVEESSDDESETANERLLRRMEVHVESLRKTIHDLLLDDRNKISKAVGVNLLRLVDGINSVVLDAATTVKYYEGREDERKYQDDIRIKEIKARPVAVPSFAEVAAAKKTTVRDIQPRKVVDELESIAATKKPVSNCAILIKADGKEGAEVEKKLLEVARPKLPNLKVKRMKRMKSAVFIELDSVGEKKKLEDCHELRACGLKMEAPGELHPRVIVADVSRELTDEAIINEIKEKNDIPTETLRIVGKRSVNADSHNVVIEGKWSIIKSILDNRRLFLGWDSCRVSWCDPVQRCFNCYAYNHLKRNCPVKKQVCRRCGEEGHAIKDCKQQKPVCRNCQQRKKKCSHDVMDPTCPEYSREFTRTNAKINFG